MNEFTIDNLKKWVAALEKIFPGSIPEHAEWNTLPEMISVLNAVAGLNHCFYPEGGGNDLMSASLSTFEENCIDLKLGGGIDRVLPARLYFECINDVREMAYLRLETKKILIKQPDTDFYQGHEHLMEYPDGTVDLRSTWDQGGDVDEHGVLQPFPEGTKLLNRWTEGAFVIFAKGSPYNLDHRIDGYDGKHNSMTGPQFRQFIYDHLAEAQATI